MTNPGLPPRLSKSSQDVAAELSRALKESLDALLAEVDDALASQPDDGVPYSRQDFNQPFIRKAVA
jgi:hypothetical protein